LAKPKFITQAYLKSILHYDPETGEWRWLEGAQANLPTNNTSGCRGVDWYARRKKWRVRGWADGKIISLGSFDKLEDAIAARLAHKSREGTIAGTIGDGGYRIINIAGVLYRAHRLAFLYMEGKMPDADVDHKNCKRDDNRWEKIRHATRSQNHCNTKRRRDNTSGHKGVDWMKARQKWRARVNFGGKRLHLGLFESREEAICARRLAAEELHGEFVRHV